MTKTNKAILLSTLLAASVALMGCGNRSSEPTASKPTYTGAGLAGSQSVPYVSPAFESDKNGKTVLTTRDGIRRWEEEQRRNAFNSFPKP